jgi:drug/metabolite transporter (DMT)-like permease
MPGISMFDLNYFLVAVSVLTIAVGQILFKYAALNIRIVPDRTAYELICSNILSIGMVGLALLLYFVSTIAWIQALRTMPLSIAYTFNALSFLIVPIAGVVLFGEALPRFFIIGSLMIVFGISLVAVR